MFLDFNHPEFEVAKKFAENKNVNLSIQDFSDLYGWLQTEPASIACHNLYGFDLPAMKKVLGIDYDMFKDKDRTKFFDYIIPVVPFINSSNSSKKIIDLLRSENLLNEESEENNNKVDAKFIKDISLYINDMRFLTNVFNEDPYIRLIEIKLQLSFAFLY